MNPWELAYKHEAFKEYTKEEIDEMLFCELEEIIYNWENNQKLWQ